MFVFKKQSHKNLLLWFLSNLKTYSVEVHENDYVVTSTDEEALNLYRICKDIMNLKFYIKFNYSYCLGVGDCWYLINNDSISTFTIPFDKEHFEILNEDEFFNKIKDYEIFKTVAAISSNFN